ncbi:MAG: 5-(carboxyamino)imidazole ribonucleotide synthase [Moraxellaceae bacterium]|nr:5-(carboxyamino)imidazole ribonucleotide synthase [Moraxellaceae bacterium]
MQTTIGIFGGGQLGAMLAQSALSLGIKCVFLEDAPNCTASHFGKVYSSNQLDEFLQVADVFTLEFENTDANIIAQINANNKRCYPSDNVLRVAQDRLQEKTTFNELGIDTVPFMAIYSQADLTKAVAELGLPIVLKTTRGGYDGKGQYIIKTHDDIDRAWQQLGGSVPLIAEGFIHFSNEVSIIAVRGQDGQIKSYPLVENHHHNGILSHSYAPAIHLDNQHQLTEQANVAISKLLEHFNYVGVLTLELFVTENGILANEIAPRVHNSGHWSIEGAVCSQFENHIRAVVGLPLGSTEIVRPSMMINVIGNYPNTSEVLAIDNTHLHHYCKSERENRKIAHITLMPYNERTKAEITAILPNKMGLVE